MKRDSKAFLRPFSGAENFFSAVFGFSGSISLELFGPRCKDNLSDFTTIFMI